MKRWLLLLLLSASASAATPNETLSNIDFTPPLGTTVPLDAVFADESGAQVRLGDLVGDKPAVLVPVYYECPMLCTLSLNGLLKAARSIRPSAGKDFTVIAVSIDPDETPALASAKRDVYRKGYNRDGAQTGWRFLTGSTTSINALTEAIGFRYVFDEKSGQFGHASAVAIVSKDGKLTRGLYGPEFAPKDLKLALMEASEGRIGNPVEKVLMYCYAFDGSTGKYSMAVMNVVRVSGATMATAMLAFVGVQIRRERKQRRPEERS